MRSAGTLTLDILLIVLAIIIASTLRDNFEPSQVRLLGLIPYAAATALLAVVLIPLFGLEKTVWRLSSLPDYLRVLAAITAVVIGAVAVTFLYNRLDGVPRSLPLLHGLVAVGLLVGGRIFARAHHQVRKARQATQMPLRISHTGTEENLLVVGMSGVAEAYVRAVTEFAPRRLKVAGLLARKERHIGRRVGANKVLGVADNVCEILGDLQVHGITVDRIVVAEPFAALSTKAQFTLLELERSGAVELQCLIEQLGLVDTTASRSPEEVEASLAEPPQVRFEIRPGSIKKNAARPYWTLKRVIDCGAALVLLIIAAPLMIIAGVLLAATIGSPVVFWQQRPGLGGRPFRLYKFRTMAAAHAPDGRLLTDEERTFALGTFLRRTRLDELPQLFNILRGDMSFVGPRPLLLRDQSPADSARLLVRPGLTGWAQVVGGRAISADDKAALDVWYVKHASLLLDLSILAAHHSNHPLRRNHLSEPDCPRLAGSWERRRPEK